MLKRFFLKSGAEPIAIGCWPLLLMAMFTFITGFFYHWILVLFFFVLGLIIWNVACVLIENTCFFPSNGLRNRLALKVKDGRVVEASNRFWKEAGYEYHKVVLPNVTEGTFELVAYLSFEKKGVSTKVRIPLTCH
ncbi:MAG: hypothetical protein MUP45_02250 [Candidatus Marinimicrobia bacterium]|nr:hypothetical protein [Candidatus Neomarinimicrobiota bacterium]